MIIVIRVIIIILFYYLSSIRLPEVRSESSRLLQCLCEHLVLPNIVVGHGTTSEPHGFLEMSTCDLRHGIVLVHLV